MEPTRPSDLPEIVRAIVAEVDAFYPRDLWPCVTDQQLASLHEWARAAHGLPDGSRFHVAGIRHALRLVQQIADDVDTTARILAQIGG